jgi:hypothetical protein
VQLFFVEVNFNIVIKPRVLTANCAIHDRGLTTLDYVGLIAVEGGTVPRIQKASSTKKQEFSITWKVFHHKHSTLVAIANLILRNLGQEELSFTIRSLADEFPLFVVFNQLCCLHENKLHSG